MKAAPIQDPVDRRNAPFVQVLLIFLGCAVPSNAAYYLFVVQSLHEHGVARLVDLGTDLLITLAAWAGLAIIRKGWFHTGVVVFLATVLVSASFAYATAGFGLAASDRLPALLLILGGLVLGRRALWIIFGLLMVVFGLGMMTDVLRSLQSGHAADTMLGSAPPVVLGYVIIALVLDRTVAALRETLAESDARRRDLEHANANLEREMRERERVHGQLIHAQKMEAVGRVASGVAHDFDNVLSVILGYTARRERLADGGVPALLEAMEGVEIAAERATMVSRNLLRFGRLGSEHVQLLDVCEVLRDVQPMLRQLCGARVRLAVHVPDDALPVLIDRGQLELMLLSLASNACDAMLSGGRFTITAHRSDTGDVVVQLSDTGHGISEADMERIFEPFYTTKPIGSGTGLGLSVVHDVMEHAGGSIDVQSSLGEGAVFRMRFPAAEGSLDSGQTLPPSANR